MTGCKVFKGSGVYCNGVALTVLSAALVVVRRNGFRQSSLRSGESVRHRGTVVTMDSKGLSIKAGGKRVDVTNEPFEGHAQRLFCLADKQFTTTSTGTPVIKGTLCFYRVWFHPDGKAKHTEEPYNGSMVFANTVVDSRTMRLLGYYEW